MSGGASAASRRATYCRGASFQCGVKGESAGTGGCSALGALGRREDDVVAATAAMSMLLAKLPNTLLREKMKRRPSAQRAGVLNRCIAWWPVVVASMRIVSREDGAGRRSDLQRSHGVCCYCKG